MSDPLPESVSMPGAWSVILGWEMGTTTRPTRSQRELAERIVVTGAPELANMLHPVDVIAAREVLDMARWPRIGSWRTGSDDVPDGASLRLAEAVVEALPGEPDDSYAALVRFGYSLGECRRMLRLAAESCPP